MTINQESRHMFMLPGADFLRNKVVAGGTGEVGAGVVKRFLREGARVVVPFRTVRKKLQLLATLDAEDRSRLGCLEVRINSFESARRHMAEVERKYGRVDLAVASLDGWEGGYKLHELDYEEWMRIIENNFNTHFIFAKLCLSLFYRQHFGMYVNLNGSTTSFPVQAVFIGQVDLVDNELTKSKLAWNQSGFIFGDFCRQPVFKLSTQDFDFQTGEEHYAEEQLRN